MIRRENKKGFSLIEVILALSIFTIVSFCVYRTFWSGIQISRRFEQHDGIYRDVHSAFDLIEKDLENMVPYDFSNSYPAKAAFVGTSGKISFVLRTVKGLRLVSYSLMTPEEGIIHKVIIGERYTRNVTVIETREVGEGYYYLVREERPFVDYLADNEENIEKEIIVTNVQENGLKFAYGYTSLVQSSGFEWKDQWQSAQLPSHIQITINFIVSEGSQNRITLRKDVWIPSGSLGAENVFES